MKTLTITDAKKNLGRWLAFEQRFGRDLRAYMPAASGVGIRGSQFILSFIAENELGQPKSY